MAVHKRRVLFKAREVGAARAHDLLVVIHGFIGGDVFNKALGFIQHPDLRVNRAAEHGIGFHVSE